LPKTSKLVQAIDLQR